MIRQIGNKNDRKIVRKRPLEATKEVREKVVKRHKANAEACFIALVQWMISGKKNGEPIPQSKCDILRTIMTELKNLNAGVLPDWRKALERMELEIKASHKIQKAAEKPSVVGSGILNYLNEISRLVAAGKATPDMLGNLENMRKLVFGMAGGESLAASVEATIASTQNALQGTSKQPPKIKVTKPTKPRPVRDDTLFREECSPLIGVKDALVAALCIIKMAERRGSPPIEFARKANTMGGIIAPEIMSDIIQLLEQEAKIGTTSNQAHAGEDNIRRDGGKLVGQTGIVEGGESIGADAQRIITMELKRKNPLTPSQRIAFETERVGLAFEKDMFKVIDEVTRIANRFNWRPLAVAAHAACRAPGIRSEIAGDILRLLEQDEALSAVKDQF
ncbi:hypothetical protein MLH22_13315 [Escherichia coli]|uniref:hypothetical protein n=2 Tax=Escherichia coli TaxID=562 RepID=UPI001867C317|nr:hypothetical protein [Escherichia coli]EIL5950578.1 hypothetical protein [Escherichia coli]MBS8599321.1 hypothetical protein [Escherichia coli]MCN4947245.1 hypothetical protein [Escherichia coli]MCN6294795.1 hypothetical protein [Escherichia coli]MCV1039903.1 hypothetical protein [Escherichia coli]